MARCDVFGDVPAGGSWRTAVLADGNVGIGGDPVRLLRRVGALLAADAEVLCELDPPGAISRQVRARLEGTRGRVSRWFPWAYVTVDDVAPVAEAACLRHTATWQKAGRWFVTPTTQAPGWLESDRDTGHRRRPARFGPASGAVRCAVRG